MAKSKRKSSAVSKDLELEAPVRSKRKSSSESEKVNGQAQKRNSGRIEADKETYERFIGNPIPSQDAIHKYPERYKDDSKVTQAQCHYVDAEVDGQLFSLDDDAYVQAEPGEDCYICKIKELFKGKDGLNYFKAQWYFRAHDTAIQICGKLIDSKRIFLSEDTNDNLLESLVRKVQVAILPRDENIKSSSEFYCDKLYLPPFTSFVNFPSDTSRVGPSKEEDCGGSKTLLDLYSGCGAMSTGLCSGANIAGVKLMPTWALDFDKNACETLRKNHPDAQVRNMAAENYLILIKEWNNLCSSQEENTEGGNMEEDDSAKESAEYEVEEILDICYGKPSTMIKKTALYFKVHWKGFGSDEDTWEPLVNLSGCKDKLRDFISRGKEARILPLPGTVDVLCGGPPCQGISGFNRFRNKDEPLKDMKNKQLLVFLEIVDFLKPRHLLMENVVDIVQFSGGYLGRYGMGSLVAMGYQVRVGLIAAGAFGVPQFRRRMFMWGALSDERLPQFPLPTHDVVSRGNIPSQFENNVVDFGADVEVHLKKALCLDDAISDLPPVGNDETSDVMDYGSEAKTDFQKFIRLRKDEMPGFRSDGMVGNKLYDHIPYHLNNDDYARVCLIPVEKGANFRDLPGLILSTDGKTIELDPDVPRELLPSGKPLIPDYAVTFKKGRSKKPFARLWGDETVSTVVTRAEPHNQKIIHPEQHRVLTVRENARLQGFPDFYKLYGPIKSRYRQVGNAVAVPVGCGLGYCLGLAIKRRSGDEPVYKLPEDFPMMRGSD